MREYMHRCIRQYMHGHVWVYIHENAVHFGRMQRHSRFALLIPPDEKRQKFVNLHKKFALFGLYCSIFSNRFNLEPVCCIIADRIINDLRKIIATIKAAIEAAIEAVIEAAIEAQKSKNP